jgi:hypothetical protein
MGRGGSAAALLLVATVALVAAACGGSAPGPTSSGSPPVTSSPTSSSPPGGPTATSIAGPTGTAPSGSAAPVDPSLLEVLPDEVGGLPVQPAPDALADAVRDPAIVRDVEALAGALVIDPAGEEFAFATVLRFHEGVPTDDFLRDWRDSFDEGVCEQAGGVSGKAEAEIGGRLVFIGSCANGAHTYHAWLGNRGVLVSVSAVGDHRLGEQLVEDLND